LSDAEKFEEFIPQIMSGINGEIFLSGISLNFAGRSWQMRNLTIEGRLAEAPPIGAAVPTEGLYFQND
jgi:hypothetical protein